MYRVVWEHLCRTNPFIGETSAFSGRWGGVGDGSAWRVGGSAWRLWLVIVGAASELKPLQGGRNSQSGPIDRRARRCRRARVRHASQQPSATSPLRRSLTPRTHATMRGDRGDRAARDTRHNKDHENLKSSLKKGAKTKKHRVVFDESANEFFEADYIIVVRDECSDEGETEECAGCAACERFQEPEPGALSPPEGYKDMGLFNRDGTLREQAWWDAGDVMLVGERSGTVFTPQHLQLLRRLQRERTLRSAVCADCDAHPTTHQPLGECQSPCPCQGRTPSRRPCSRLRIMFLVRHDCLRHYATSDTAGFSPFRLVTAEKSKKPYDFNFYASLFFVVIILTSFF